MKRAIMMPLLLAAASALPQSGAGNKHVTAYSDTVYGLAFDSLTSNLGTVPPGRVQLTRRFKYIDSSAGTVLTAWTSDPYFICQYPREPLIPGKEYEFVICCIFSAGLFHKVLGFVLPDGRRITMILKGEVKPPG